MPPKHRYKKGEKIGERYYIHKVLSGGFGEVYLCLDLEELYPYALKTFKQRYQKDREEQHQDLEREVSSWIALQKHPNIVRCFYMKTIDKQPFVFLEWVRGTEGKRPELRDWLREGALDLRLALDFTIDICRGLIHAQRKCPGLVHCDLNPRNVLVARGRLAKITDFGLAQIIRNAGLEIDRDGVKPHRASKRNAGTPAYMAPEQWRGETPDIRTDIYALGCILYEMLTAKQPFRVDFLPTTISERRRWLHKMRTQHENSPIPTLPADYPAAVNALVERCLAKRREDRFDTVEDLLQALESMYRQRFGEPPRAIPTQDGFTVVDYANRGNTYDELQYYEKALADYTRAIQMDSTYALAYNNRGKTYTALEHYEQALADLNRAIDLAPTYTKAYVNRGNVFYAREHYEEALADYNKAIQLDPSCAPAYGNRGVVFNKLQRYQKALEDHNRAIELAPLDAAAYSNRGDTYGDLHHYDKAVADYERSIHLDPDHAQVHNNCGAIYHKYRSYGKALEHFTKAIQIDPTYAKAYYNLGNTYDEIQQYREALHNYTRAIELDPTYAQAYSDRGVTYYNRGEYEKALADYNRAIEIDPKLAMAYSNRGLIYDKMQRHDQALAEHLQAIKVDPTYALAYLNAGILLYNHGQLQQALVYFVQAAHHGDPRGEQYARAVQEELGM